MRTRRYGWLGAGRYGRLGAGLLWAVTGLVPSGVAWAGDSVLPAPPALGGAEGTVSVPAAPRPAPAEPGVREPASPGAGAAADPAVPAVGGVWPVGVRPALLRGWDPPVTPYGPGHRGVDLASPPGAPVRAVAAGRVSFAGRVAGRGVVSVELSGTGTPPLRTTYEPVRPSVKKGTEVAAGDVLGTLDPSSHCGGPSCLHWGLREGETYLNPLALLPPWLAGDAPPRLLPVLGVPLPG